MKKLLLTLTLVAGSAHAEFWDGNKLLANMNGHSGEQLMALGYVIGAADAIRGRAYCPPTSSITAGQVYDIVKQAVERLPQSRHLSADSFVAASLGTAWPCERRTPGKAL